MSTDEDDPTDVPPDGRVLFYERDRERFGFLSNFHPSVITIDGTTWPTLDHFYQAQKPLDPDYREAIGKAYTPGVAKRLGALPVAGERAPKQSWFRRNAAEPRADWDAVKLDVMRRAVHAKFEQNEDLRTMILATGSAEIVEDSGGDAFWGARGDGHGENWLGRILMETREALRANGDGAWT